MSSLQGKTTITWNDTLKSGNASIESPIQHWLELGDADLTRPFISKGGKVIFSDMFTLYFDYLEIFSSLKKVYNYTPTIKGETYDCCDNCLGVEACLWSERVTDPTALYTLIYPRLFAVAEAVWTTNRDYKDFEERLKYKLNDLSLKGISYLPLEMCNPDEEKRIEGGIEFLKRLSAATSEGSVPIFSPEMLQQFLINFELEALLKYLS